MNNPWVEHIKNYAEKNGITYACAIPEAAKTYKKLTAQELENRKSERKNKKKMEKNNQKIIKENQKIIKKNDEKILSKINDIKKSEINIMDVQSVNRSGLDYDVFVKKDLKKIIALEQQYKSGNKGVVGYNKNKDLVWKYKDIEVLL